MEENKEAHSGKEEDKDEIAKAASEDRELAASVNESCNLGEEAASGDKQRVRATQLNTRISKQAINSEIKSGSSN